LPTRLGFSSSGPVMKALAAPATFEGRDPASSRVPGPGNLGSSLPQPTVEAVQDSLHLQPQLGGDLNRRLTADQRPASLVEDRLEDPRQSHCLHFRELGRAPVPIFARDQGRLPLSLERRWQQCACGQCLGPGLEVPRVEIIAPAGPNTDGSIGGAEID